MPGVTETFPFGNDTLVYKVMGKMFALATLSSIPLRINLKCDPEKAIELREKYESVLPGYHMNKTHWNSIVLDNTIPDKEIFNWIVESYKLVVSSLKKNEREKLNLPD
jgi:predicted DNA-binding protein (MmcQ/YjbR family)